MTTTLEQKLSQVREQFCRDLPSRLDEIVCLLDSQTTSEPSSILQIHRTLHELFGSAGMLGERTISCNLWPGLLIAESCTHSQRDPSEAEMTELRSSVVAASNSLKSL